MNSELKTLLFFVLVGLAIYFRDYFGQMSMPFTFFILLFGTLVYFAGSGMIEQGKNAVGQIIGDKIKNSILLEDSIDYKQYKILSLGGWDYAGFRTRGKEEIIIVPKSQIIQIDESVRILGETEFREKEQIPYSLQEIINKKFGFLPDYVKIVKPNFVKEFTNENGQKITLDYIDEIIAENRAISAENTNLRQTINQLIGDTTKILDFGVSAARSVKKGFSREFKILEKQEK